MFVDALTRNIAATQASGPVLVDVSADGYGHGTVRVAAAARAAGARSLFAATVDDALRTAALVPGADVVVGRVAPGRIDEIRAAGISPLSERPDERVGRDALYGFDGVSAPALSLRSRVLSTKAIREGDGVSYGYTYRAPRDGRTALVGVGYGDGVHRHAGNTVSVLIDGERLPVVGRVAMNVFVVFLDDRAVADGAPVVLFGDPDAGEPSVVDWAAALQVDPAAVTAGIAPRVERIGA
ncbi:alanine racemase C-terminal domain-containing protein [Labedella populi]|uniref:alanine racemase C-terminal domain-containing protein n=1 Tax=Labedella populi TaxID=2498850 RepID=UPI00140887A3|nr:alanine racemase C-terminal domain-containing protein [Labedella populi]